MAIKDRDYIVKQNHYTTLKYLRLELEAFKKVIPQTSLLLEYRSGFGDNRVPYPVNYAMILAEFLKVSLDEVCNFDQTENILKRAIQLEEQRLSYLRTELEKLDQSPFDDKT